jgi:hypothetical protein
MLGRHDGDKAMVRRITKAVHVCERLRHLLLGVVMGSSRYRTRLQAVLAFE